MITAGTSRYAMASQSSLTSRAGTRRKRLRALGATPQPKEVETTTDETDGGTAPVNAGQMDRLRPAAAQVVTGIDTRYASMLLAPKFHDLEGFARAMDVLDGVTTEDVFMVDDGQQDHLVEGFKAVASKEEPTYAYSIVSDKYQPIQDVEVIQPLFDAVQQRGLAVSGTIWEASPHGKTRTLGVLRFDNEAVVLEDGDLMLGLMFHNGYAGDMSFGGEALAIREICGNGNIFGRLLGQVRHRHIGDVTPAMADWDKLIDRILTSRNDLANTVERLRTVELDEDTVGDVLWGINFGPAKVEAITSDLAGWEPTIATAGLNPWTLYNSVTAYLTWRPHGGQYRETTEANLRTAERLLTENLGALELTGRARREAFEAEQEERAKARREAITASQTPQEAA